MALERVGYGRAFCGGRWGGDSRACRRLAAQPSKDIQCYMGNLSYYEFFSDCNIVN
jgi:hypothetical protein